MDYYKKSLEIHEKIGGKIETTSKLPLRNIEDLSIAYTPGVAAPCLAIAEDEDKVYKYTTKQNTVAIVTDGSAVLGLGNIGAKASLPVMEGKAILFKEFADVNAFPICIEAQDVDEIVSIVKNISPGFGGINLEDIAAPRCFEIEEILKEELDIPVFHDDQHGTAIVTCAALINALKIVDKSIDEIKIVMNGAGAAGVAIAKMLKELGARDIIACDSKGIISLNRKDELNKEKIFLANLNADNMDGGLADALINAHVFIGVSAPNTMSADMVKTMNKDAIIFAMANPEPEIMPDVALKAGARIVGTGRSDFDNQINNVLAFPGIFKGALKARAKQITEPMKIAAAYAIAESIEDDELSETFIIPSIFQEGISDAVADAVMKAWNEKNKA